MTETLFGQITHLVPGQDDKEVTANNALERLGAQINDVFTIDMADADVNLSVSQEFESGVIRATGANAAVRDLVLVAGQDRANFWVWNDSTGGFDVQVRYAAGAAVNISPGVVQAVFADGTDVRAVTPFDIRQFANKTTPVTGDRFLMQEAGGAFKSVDTPNMPGSGGGGGGITAIGLSNPDWQVIKEIDAVGLTSVDLSTFDPSLYTEYEISAPNIDFSADALLVIQIMVAGVVQNSAGDYQYTFHGSNASTTDFAGGTLSGSGIIWPTLGGTAANELMGFWVRAGPMDNGSHKHLIASAFGDDTSGNDNHFEVSGKFKASTSDVNGFRITTTTGVPTITGKFILRGRRKKEAFSVLTNAGAYRYASVVKTAGQSIVNNSFVKVTWDSATHDPEGFFDNANDQFVVPVGVDLVRLTAMIDWSTMAATGRAIIGFYKNGTAVYFDTKTPNTSSLETNIQSPLIPVGPGDTLHIEVNQNTGSSRTIDATQSVFQMEVVEPTPSGQSIALVQTTDGTLTSVLEVPLASDSAVVVTGTLTSWDATNKTIETVDLVATFKNVAGTSSLVDKHFTQHPGIGAQFAITFDVDDAADLGRIRVQRTSGAGTFEHDLRYRAIQRV